MSAALAGGFFTSEPPGKPLVPMALDSSLGPDKPWFQFHEHKDGHLNLRPRDFPGVPEVKTSMFLMQGA